ncbi:MAG: 3-phosphoshikimate 1-carboxyvinyltransferase [Oscillospiraceae bacterium]
MKAIVRKHPVEGNITVPSSKSHTIRALIIATLAGGRSVISNPLLSEDCKAAMRIAQQFGSTVTVQEGKWIVDGPKDGLRVPDDVVNVDNSGTTLYFMTSIAALLPEWTVFTGDASIRKRAVTPLLNVLKQLGAEAETTRKDCDAAPFFIRGPIKGGTVEVPCTTSQYISSLMIAAPICQGTMRITTQKPTETPYLDMTIKWLREAGITVNYDEAGHKWFEIAGGQRYLPFEKVIPSDWSSVAFPTVAGLVPGSELVINNMDFQDTQGDAAVIDHLIRMGADITKDSVKGSLIMRGGNKLRGITIDMLNTPDALPILSVVGALAEGTTVLDNVAGARLKETDRVQAMTESLKKMGVDIEATENTITIHGGKPLQGCELESYQDHRIAMALTVAGLYAEGTTTIRDAECASVTFPDFYEKLNNIGAGIVLED